MIKVIKKNKAFISYEDMGDYIYLHELRNKDNNMDGLRIIKRFVRIIKKPIIASTLRLEIATVARRYGFDIYKRVSDRLFLIRR